MEKKEKNGMSTAKVVVIAIVMFFVGAGGLYALMYFYPDPFVKTISEEIKNVTITDTGLADAVDKIYDAVVVVKTYKNNQLYSTGTGFVYKKDDHLAYILTNNHVIESGDSIVAEFTDGRQIETTVEGSDVYSDIAVLSLDAKEVSKVAEMGSSEEARVGDTVFTVGAPIDASAYSGTVTRGILSGKNRLVGVSTENSNVSDMMMSVLQTDAAINSGNSGGPLVNANGEVIGITSLKLSSSGLSSTASIEGMGFAIPIETALNYAEKLENGESIERPVLGIEMINVSDMYYSTIIKLGVTSGVYVNKVQDNSPAKAGGMQNGDVIVEVDDQEVSNLAYLRYLLYNHDIGDSMKVTVYRNGDYKDLEIHLTEKAS